MAWRDSDPWLDTEPWGEHDGRPVNLSATVVDDTSLEPSRLLRRPPVSISATVSDDTLVLGVSLVVQREDSPWIGASVERGNDVLFDVRLAVRPVDPPAPGEIIDATLWWSDSKPVKYVRMSATLAAEEQVKGRLIRPVPRSLAATVVDDIQVQNTPDRRVPLSAGLVDDHVVQPAPLFPQGTTQRLLGTSIQDEQIVSARLSKQRVLGAGVTDDIQTSAWISYLRSMSATAVDDTQLRAALKILLRLYGSLSDDLQPRARLHKALALAATVSPDAQVSAFLKILQRLYASLTDDLQVRAALDLAKPMRASLADDIVPSAWLAIAIPLRVTVTDDIRVSGGLEAGVALSATVDDDIQMRARMRKARILGSGSVADDLEMRAAPRYATALSASLTEDSLLSAEVRYAKVLATSISDDTLVSGKLHRARSMYATLTDDLQTRAEMRYGLALRTTVVDDLALTAQARMAKVLGSGRLIDEHTLQANLDLALPLFGSVQDDHRITSTSVLATRLYGSISDDFIVTSKMRLAYLLSASMAAGELNFLADLDIAIPLRANMTPELMLLGKPTDAKFFNSTVEIDLVLRAALRHLAPNQVQRGQIVDDVQIRAAMRLARLLSSTSEVDVRLASKARMPLFAKVIGPARVSTDVQIRTKLWLRKPKFMAGSITPDLPIHAKDPLGTKFKLRRIFVSASVMANLDFRAGMVAMPSQYVKQNRQIAYHNFQVGQVVTLSGAGAPYDGTYIIASVSDTSFTVIQPGVAGAEPFVPPYGSTVTPVEQPVSNIVSAVLTSGVVTITTTTSTAAFVVGQKVQISGLGYPFDGTFTVTGGIGVSTLTRSTTYTITYNRPGIPDAFAHLGPTATLISGSVTNGLVTLTADVTNGPHGYIPGMIIVVAGLGYPYDGRYLVTSVTGNTISYARPNVPDGTTVAQPTATTGATPTNGPYVHPVPGGTEPQVIVGAEVSGNGDITLTTGVYVDLPPSGADHAEPPDGYEYKVPLSGARTRHACPRPSLIPGALGYTGPGINGSGGVGVSSIDAIISIMAASGIPHRVTSTYRSTSDTYHGTSNAVDFASPVPSVDSPELDRIAAFWTQFAAGMLEIIYSGPGSVYVKDGKFVAPYAVSIHHDHVHVAATLDGLQSVVTALPVQAPAAEEGTTFNSRMDGGNSAGSGETALKGRVNIYEYPKERLPL